MGEDTGSKTGGCAGTTYSDGIYVSYRDISSDNDCGRNVFYDKYRYRKGNRVLSRYSGRGHILSEESLSEEEIDEIVEDSGASEEQEAVIRYALSKVGYPYSQEDRTSGSAYDCSSLVYYSWLSAGVDLSYGAGYPPTAAAEASKLYSYGTAVSTTRLDMRDMEPGDLVFYGGHDNKRFLGIYHVALYVGNGEVVEALNADHGVVYETLRTNNIILVLRP